MSTRSTNRELRFVAENVLGKPPEQRGFVLTRDGRWHLPELARLARLLRARQRLESGWILSTGSGHAPRRVLIAFDPASQQILDAKLLWTPMGDA